jgi:hypothetical protein
MAQQSLEMTLDRDFLIEDVFNSSTKFKEYKNIMEYIIYNINFTEPPKIFTLNLLPLLEIDPSSISPNFEINTETTLIDEFTISSDEELAMEILDEDFIVKMQPKKRYKILANVGSIKKGEPNLFLDYDFYL